MTAPIEIEAKLLIPDRKTLDHLRACSHIAGYFLEQAHSSTIHDSYLDTPGRALLAAGYACRRREQDGRILVTLKTTSTAGDVIHRRTEIEVSLEADAPPALWPQGEARFTVLKIIGTETLVELFRLRQERFVRCAFHGDRLVAAVSLDEVLVEGSNGGRRWRELEIELLPDGREKDIADMAAWARARFGLTPSLHSKFERALSGQS